MKLSQTGQSAEAAGETAVSFVMRLSGDAGRKVPSRRFTVPSGVPRRNKSWSHSEAITAKARSDLANFSTPEAKPVLFARSFDLPECFSVRSRISCRPYSKASPVLSDRQRQPSQTNQAFTSWSNKSCPSYRSRNFKAALSSVTASTAQAVVLPASFWVAGISFSASSCSRCLSRARQLRSAASSDMPP